MGFFSNSNQSHQNTRSDSTTTIITAGTKITGNINLTCNLYIDGYFEGNITSDKEINIGKSGKIKGEINAFRVVVQGLAEGSINATRVDIKSEGKVTGSVESEEFVIEAKGIFEGNSALKKNQDKLCINSNDKENKTENKTENKIELSNKENIKSIEKNI